MPVAVPQMFESALEPLKGWGANLHCLDYRAPLNSTLLTGATAVPAGRMATINSSGEFVLGYGGNNKRMPIFLWQGKTSPDVYNNGVSPTTSVAHWWGVSSRGYMSGLVASGGYELQTTEFDTARSYAANDLLTANSSGILTNESVTLYTTPVCGVCSFHKHGKSEDAPATSPAGTNANGVSVLSFWTVYLPAA